VYFEAVDNSRDSPQSAGAIRDAPVISGRTKSTAKPSSQSHLFIVRNENRNQRSPRRAAWMTPRQMARSEHTTKAFDPRISRTSRAMRWLETDRRVGIERPGQGARCLGSQRRRSILHPHRRRARSWRSESKALSCVQTWPFGRGSIQAAPARRCAIAILLRTINR